MSWEEMETYHEKMLCGGLLLSPTKTISNFNIEKKNTTLVYNNQNEPESTKCNNLYYLILLWLRSVFRVLFLNGKFNNHQKCTDCFWVNHYIVLVLEDYLIFLRSSFMFKFWESFLFTYVYQAQILIY